MIEQIMIFALGFLVAGVLALLVLPLFWRRALRLSRRRVEMQMPLSMTEVVADRDRLRAEFAVERCRLEQSYDDIYEKWTTAMSALGRAETAALALSAEFKASEEALTSAQFRIHEIEAQFGAFRKETHDADALLAERSEALAFLEREHRSLGQIADERRALNAALETRLSALEMRFADALRDVAAARAAHAESAAQSRIFAERGDAAREQAASLERQNRELASRASAQEDRFGEATSALARTREDLAQATAEGEDLRREVLIAQERAKALRSSLERHVETRRVQEQDLVERLESTQAQVAVLKAALEEARRDHADSVRATSARRRPGSREARSIKGLEVVAAERTDERTDPKTSLAEDSLLDRPA